MSFSSFIVLVGMLCFVVSVVLGYLALTSDPAHAAGSLVMAVAGALFIWIAQIGKGSS